MLFSVLGFIALAAWVYLALGHGWFWLPLVPENTIPAAPTPSIDIIVPARNEADILPLTLPSLLTQDYAGDWRVILVDDHSTDNTATVARKIAEDAGRSERLVVVSAPDMASGWAGKVAAMNEGVAHSRANMILFTDADIAHAAHSLRDLVSHSEKRGIDLTSRMVTLHCASFAEKLLIPAFVFFFALLYPFRRVNHPRWRVAAAAGGVMLVRRAMLDKIGGMAAIKSALIDDCSLAKSVKAAGGKIELTLTRDSRSLRPYPHLADIMAMVSRTAYTQLRYSPALLILTLLGMAVLYLCPVLFFLLSLTHTVMATGLLSLLIMTAIYMPMVKFYRLPAVWALTLPVASLVYGVATFRSAWLYHQGKGGQWKNRVQAS